MLETVSVARVSFFGTGDFEGILGTNIAPITASPEDTGMNLSSLVDSGTPVPDRAGSFTVLEGTTFLIGGVGSWQDGEVSNASFWIKDPNGALMNTTTNPDATDPNSESVYIIPHNAGEGTVLSFILSNPTPGQWSVGLNYDESVETPPFQLSVMTIPNGGLERMNQTFKTMYDQKHSSDLVASKKSHVSGACIGCQIGAFALALTIATAGTAVILTLTSVSAVAAALAAFVGCTPAVALAWLIGICTIGTGVMFTVDYVLTQLCTWTGACS